MIPKEQFITSYSTILIVSLNKNLESSFSMNYNINIIYIYIVILYEIMEYILFNIKRKGEIGFIRSY